jgi:HlyD family secretion protein
MDIQKIRSKISDIYQNNKKWVWIGGGVVLLIAFLGIYFSLSAKTNSEETVVQYVQVSRGSLTESIDVVGTLEAQPSVKLSWQSGGIVSPISIQIGDQVIKDEVVMELEDSSLSASVLQAQTDLITAQAELGAIKSANVNLYTAMQTLSDAEYTLRQYNTNRSKWNVKGSSWDAIESARADYYAAKEQEYQKESAYNILLAGSSNEDAKTSAHAEYKDAISAREEALRKLNNLLGSFYTYSADTDFILYDQAAAAVKAARVDYNRYLDQTDEIAAAEANVQALENTINQSMIIAPFDGTITDISAVNGELVSSGDTAVRIDNLNNLVVKVSVSEVDINKVQIGQSVIVTFDALSSIKYQGEVTYISNAGNSDSGVVEFSVTVKVLDADNKVKPGFTAVVSIVTSNIENALLVPNGAVISRDGTSAVMLVGADNTTTMVPVETGASSDTFTEVISGDIEEGDTLAVYASNSSGFFQMMGGFRSVMGGGPQIVEERRPADQQNRQD